MVDWVTLAQIEEAERNNSAFRALGRAYVPGEGPAFPKVMIIGEAPGAQEVLARRPFVGPSGLVLRRLMKTAGLSVHTNAWITNVVKFRPPGNRVPTLSEIIVAREYLVREWVAIGNPRVIVAVGGTALRAAIPAATSILARAGHTISRPSRYIDEMVSVFPVLHPAFVLRNPEFRGVTELHWSHIGCAIRENRRND